MGTPLTPESMCGSCYQPDPVHLPMCQHLEPVQPPPAETPAEQEQQHNLGQAI